jgi:hypothetical protein
MKARGFFPSYKKKKKKTLGEYTEKAESTAPSSHPIPVRPILIRSPPLRLRNSSFPLSVSWLIYLNFSSPIFPLHFTPILFS